MRLSELTKKRQADDFADVSYSKVYLFYANVKQKRIKTMFLFHISNLRTLQKKTMFRLLPLRSTTQERISQIASMKKCKSMKLRKSI
jgi:hypothetical protein